MMRVTHVRRRVNGIALVMHGLLAWPRPCGLRTPPAFNAGRTLLVAGAVGHASYPYLMRTVPMLEPHVMLHLAAFVMRLRPCGSTVSPPEQTMGAGSTYRHGSPDPALAGFEWHFVGGPGSHLWWPGHVVALDLLWLEV